MGKGSGGTRASSSGSPRGLATGVNGGVGSVDAVQGYQPIYNSITYTVMSQADADSYGAERGMQYNYKDAHATVIKFDTDSYQIMEAWDGAGNYMDALEREFTGQGVKVYISKLFRSWGK